MKLRVNNRGKTPQRGLGTSARKGLFIVLLWLTVFVSIEAGTQVIYRISNGQWLAQWWAIPIFVEDSNRVYRVIENLDYLHKTSEYHARYVTDKNGFRISPGTPDVEYEKTENVFRILFLGPSFTFGWAVDNAKCYVSLIAEGLEVPGKCIEVVNAGTPAQPINYQLAWLKKEGYRYVPDLVVQTVFGQCDVDLEVNGRLPAERPLVKGGYLYPPPAETWIGRVGQKLKRWRQVSTTIFYSWQGYAYVTSHEKSSGFGRQLYEGQVLEGDWENSLLLRYRRYQDFLDDALGRKVPVVFLYIPDAHVVRVSDVVRVGHHADVVRPGAEKAKAARAEIILNSYGFPFVNLVETLVKHDKKTRMYFLYDIHFTEAGNRVAAGEAIPTIQRVIDKWFSIDHPESELVLP